ncbi:Serine/threonine-protein kinase, partial [Coemansia sp. RSA 2322]
MSEFVSGLGPVPSSGSTNANAGSRPYTPNLGAAGNLVAEESRLTASPALSVRSSHSVQSLQSDVPTINTGMANMGVSGPPNSSGSTTLPPVTAYPIVDDDEPLVRSAAEYPRATVEKAAVAKLKLESFYKDLMGQCIERNQRRKDLEQRLLSESGSSEERKQRQLQSLGAKESSFMRLRRTKLC